MDFFKKVFGGEEEAERPAVEPVVETPVSTPSRPSSLPPGLHVGRKTDVGRQREQNEDALYTTTAYIESSDGTEPFGLYIVADGMGGYQGGEIASSVAVRAASHYILKHIYLPYLSGDTETAMRTPINDVLISAVNEANEKVLSGAPEAGTTLTIAVVIGRQAYFAHVGDSRAYLYSDGKLRQITQDHSLVARMVELGQVTAEEALTHQHRNVLYRAIGQHSALEVETYLRVLSPNSYLLICSDGLWGLIPDEKIGAVLQSVGSPEEGVNALIDLANQNGGDDNITAVLIGIGEDV